MAFESLGRYRTCVGEIIHKLFTWRSGTVEEHDQIWSKYDVLRCTQSVLKVLSPSSYSGPNLTTNVSEQHTNHKFLPPGEHSPLDAYNPQSLTHRFWNNQPWMRMRILLGMLVAYLWKHHQPSKLLFLKPQTSCHLPPLAFHPVLAGDKSIPRPSSAVVLIELCIREMM